MGVLVVWCDLTHDPIDGSIIFKTFTKPEVVIPVAMTLWKYSMTIDIRKGLVLRTDLHREFGNGVALLTVWLVNVKCSNYKG